MPAKRTQAPKPEPTLQEKVEEITQSFEDLGRQLGEDDGPAVQAFTNLQDAQNSAEFWNAWRKPDAQETRVLTKQRANEMYAATARKLDKMLGLPVKSKEQYVEQAKEIFAKPGTFDEFKKEYEENQGKQSVLKFEFTGISQEEAEEQVDVLSSTFNKLCCQKCRRNCCQDGTQLKKCMRCKDTHYCSRTCQELHWKIHKKSCNKAPAAKKS
jgi:hypothetical protein